MLHTMPTTTALHRQRLPHPTPVLAFRIFHGHWNTAKRSSPLLKRLVMRCLEVIALAAVMLVIPFAIHGAMLCFDDFDDFLGRRARSPYSQISWISVVGAMTMVAAWTLVLGRLGYLVDVEVGEERVQCTGGASGRKTQRRVSWGRVLGRISIPLILVTLTGHLALDFLRRVAEPMPYITANVVARTMGAHELATGCL